MASTPAIASGVTIGTAGAGGMLAGDATGLGGFFAALVNDAAPAVPTTGLVTLPVTTGSAVHVPGVGTSGLGMISVLLNAQPGDVKSATAATDPTTGLPLINLTNPTAQDGTPTPTATVELQLGDAPALTVTGDADAVKEFVTQVQAVYQKIIVEGKLTIGQLKDGKELAGALTQMGMAPDEAAGVAARIQTMLKLLEQQQKVDDATAGSLVAMMLAVMGQGVAQQPVVADPTKAVTDKVPQLGLQIISVEQTPVTTSAGVPTGGKITSWQMRASGDVTRDLLGLDKAPDAKPDAGKDAKVATPEIVRKIEVAVTQDADASVGVAMPEIKTTHVAAPRVQTDAVPSESAQVAAAVTSSGAAVKVAADEVIEAPKGETYYKLQADKHGVETLDAVKPMAETRDAGVNLGQAQNQPAQAAAAQAVATADSASFAARVAQINQFHDMMDKAEVGKQVALQIQPLLAQGGGVVRMSLHPKDLGQVTVELQVVDGKVHGSIAATDPAVVEQLARELHNLRHGLADAGLKLGDQGINLMLSNQGQQNQNGQGGNNNRNAQPGLTAQNAPTEGSDLAVNLASWVSPDRVLDVNV